MISGVHSRQRSAQLPRTRTDGRFSLNCSVLKNIMVKERYRLRLRGEFFSVTNTPIFGAPNTNLSSADFGVVLGGGGTRNFQLAMKVIF